ncbi:MAG TPA: alpha/beta hydrolase [Gemmatimonadaceae bacterium]|nr:alpha/beta hydrolase [Gemmatimonadaceae bacterium]
MSAQMWLTPGRFIKTASTNLLLLSMLGCGAGRTRSLESAEPRPPGHLVDLGGYKLHLHCIGEGSPAVRLIPGAGDYSFDWSRVHADLGKTTRTCAYDRAGFAWSDVGPNPRTMRQEASEIHELLSRAAVPTPVLLVGHSIGGLVARVVARDFPGDVAGIVMIDPTHEDTQLFYQGRIVRIRESAKARAVSPVVTFQSQAPKASQAQLKEFAEMQHMMGKPRIEPPFEKLDSSVQRLRLWAESDSVKRPAIQEDFWPEELQQLHDDRLRTPQPLAGKPLIVIAAGREESVPDEATAEQRAQFAAIMAEKRSQKKNLPSLSRNSMFLVDTLSGHHIQIEDPAIVLRAIALAVQAIRSGSVLPRILP